VNSPTPIWISEAEVVSLMDLRRAIAALEAGLRLEAQGAARNMGKTHVMWGDGHTLHAIGAAFEGADVVGTKTWAHTAGGATPLLILWNAETGALLAIIEAFALGQMRTGAMSGVATHWMAAPNARSLALFGTGKQALAQLAAVAAVRELRTVRIWGRDPSRRDRLAQAAASLGYAFKIEQPPGIAEAADGAEILTLATRACEPFLAAGLVAHGAHINAIGAITPEREEFAQDVLERADLIAADDPAAARRLSREFARHFGSDADWSRVRPISERVAQAAPRPPGIDLSVFKAMGMGISDLALGVEIYRSALGENRGRPIDAPSRAKAQLGIAQSGEQG